MRNCCRATCRTRTSQQFGCQSLVSRVHHHQQAILRLTAPKPEVCRLGHLRNAPYGTFWHDSSVSPTIGPFDMSQLTPTHGAGTARPILGQRSAAPHPSPEGPATTAFAAPSYLERHGTPQTRPISRSAIASVFGWPPREVCTHGSLNETVRSWRSERRASSYSTMPNRLSPLHWLTAVLLSWSGAMFIGTSRISGH